jgi:hypothetical protein
MDEIKFELECLIDGEKNCMTAGQNKKDIIDGDEIVIDDKHIAILFDDWNWVDEHKFLVLYQSETGFSRKKIYQIIERMRKAILNGRMVDHIFYEKFTYEKKRDVIGAAGVLSFFMGS